MTIKTQDRQERREVKAIATLSTTYELDANQMFCSTPKSWELWQIEPLRFLKRWNQRSIYWVFDK